MVRTTTRWAVLAAVAAGLGAVPAGRADDNPGPATAAQRLTSQGKLKQFALAIINGSDVNRGAMPTDITSADGKPLLSWRVAILPYIEQQNLYQQFKLDEPWDGPTNKKLIEKMPKIYAPVRGQAKPGETFYQVFSGGDALFGPNKKPRFPASITDGTSNTGLVFEAGEPVIWSKPADLPYDAKKPLPKLGGMFDGETNVVLCDGSVMMLKKNPDEAELRKFITPADGLVIDIDKIRK